MTVSLRTIWQFCVFMIQMGIGSGGRAQRSMIRAGMVAITGLLPATRAPSLEFSVRRNNRAFQYSIQMATAMPRKSSIAVTQPLVTLAAPSLAFYKTVLMQLGLPVAANPSRAALLVGGMRTSTSKPAVVPWWTSTCGHRPTGRNENVAAK